MTAVRDPKLFQERADHRGAKYAVIISKQAPASTEVRKRTILLARPVQLVYFLPECIFKMIVCCASYCPSD